MGKYWEDHFEAPSYLELLSESLRSLRDDFSALRVTPRKLDEFRERIQRMIDKLDSIDKENFDDKRAVAERIRAYENKLDEAQKNIVGLKDELLHQQKVLTEKEEALQAFKEGDYVIECGNETVRLDESAIKQLYFKKIGYDDPRQKRLDAREEEYKGLERANRNLTKRIHDLERNANNLRSKHKAKILKKDNKIKKLQEDIKKKSCQLKQGADELCSEYKLRIQEKDAVIKQLRESKKRSACPVNSSCERNDVEIERNKQSTIEKSHLHERTQEQIRLKIYELREKWAHEDNSKLRELYSAIPDSSRFHVEDIDLSGNSVKVTLAPSATSDTRRIISDVVKASSCSPEFFQRPVGHSIFSSSIE